MLVRLYTRDGGFVVEKFIPPFKVPPEIIAWGERVFVLDANSDCCEHTPLGDIKYLRYVEGMMWTIINI